MKKIISSITFCLLLLTTATAFALSLEQAKSQGLVGETPSGYLESVSGASPEVQSLLSDINSRRREEYQAIATKNATPLQAVEELAGKKAIDRTSSGNYVKVNGKWVKK